MCANTGVIRELNDSFRAKAAGNGRLVVTQGLVGACDLPAIIAKVSSFDDFSSDNDPHGEHDFGAFDHGTRKIFWKIDYYDRELKYHSPNPADDQLTTRVLTVMLAEEY